jgi:hypothetical protein
MVAIGGFGSAPELIYQGDYDMAACAKNAAQVYKRAGDAWASSEFRSEIAVILAERVLGEVQ